MKIFMELLFKFSLNLMRHIHDLVYLDRILYGLKYILAWT